MCTLGQAGLRNDEPVWAWWWLSSFGLVSPKRQRNAVCWGCERHSLKVGIICRSCQRFGMLFYKMTCTFQVKETGRQDDTVIAKYKNYKLKTPPIHFTTPRVFKELMYLSGNTSIQQNHKTNLLSQEKKSTLQIPQPFAFFFLLSSCVFNVKEHCHLSLTPRLTIASRAGDGAGLTGHRIKHFERLGRVNENAWQRISQRCWVLVNSLLEYKFTHSFLHPLQKPFICVRA